MEKVTVTLGERAYPYFNCSGSLSSPAPLRR